MEDPASGLTTVIGGPNLLRAQRSVYCTIVLSVRLRRAADSATVEVAAVIELPDGQHRYLGIDCARAAE